MEPPVDLAPVVVAAAHASPVFMDRRATLARAAELTRAAGADGARLLVFPESFVPGFPYWVNLTAPINQRGPYVELWEQSLDLSDLGDLDPVLTAAAAHETTVVLSANARAGGTIYNVQMVIDGSDGVVEVRRKLVPTYAERTVWGRGDASTLRALDTRAGRLSALMCWEHTMNLPRQHLALQGAWLHAAAWPGLLSVAGMGEGFRRRVDLLIRAHAFLGQAFVVSAMNPCQEDVVAAVSDLPGAAGSIATGPGWSAVAGPDGDLVAEHTGTEDHLLMAEVDPRRIVEAKQLLDPAGHFARDDLFRLEVDTRPRGTGPTGEPTPQSV